MELFNWDGALIGPGSEWFWAMAQFVVVLVTLLGIYRQLRTQGAANALTRLETLQGMWSSERMVYTRLAVSLWRRDHGPTGPDPEAQVLLGWLANFFEDLSDLAEERYITWKEIENSWGQQLVLWWSLLAPAIQEVRIGNSRAYLGFERLSSRALAESTKRGESWAVEEADIADALAAQIARGEAAMKLVRSIAAGETPKASRPRRLPRRS